MKKRILSLALALVMMLSLLPATAQAAASSGTCGTNARWSLSSAGTLTISGTGSMKSYSSGNTPWKASNARIKEVVIQSGITSTGSDAFSGCTNLKTATLPTTLTTIGPRTFYGCSSLTTVNFPSKLKSIGAYAFSGCAKLSKATLPASLQTIGTYAFYSCKALTTLTVPTNVKTLPASAFSLCKGLTSVTLPAGLTSVGKSAFLSCSKLKTVNFKGTSAQWKKVTVSSGNTPLTSATIKYGTSTAKKYTVTFSANGGTVTTKTKSVTNGSTYGTLPTPTRSNYTFSGWYTSASGGTKITSASKVNLTANQTLYARWTGKKYTVTFNAGSGTVTTKSKSVTYGSTYGTLPTPTYTGYTFDGWYTASTGGTKITSASKVSLTKAQTLYAHWTKTSTSPASYTVRFDGTDCVFISSFVSKTVTNGKAYGELASVYRKGYTFDGWFTAPTGGTKITAATIVNLTANQTLYAHWTQNAPASYTVTFNANGGTVAIYSKSVTNGSTYGSLPTPTRSGYIFDGWYTELVGGTKISSTTTVNLTGNQYLYAHWTPDVGSYRELGLAEASKTVSDAYNKMLSENLVLVYYSTGCGYSQTYVPQFQAFAAAEDIPMAGYAYQNGQLYVLWQYGFVSGTVGWPVVLTYNAATKTAKCAHSVRSMDTFKQVLADNGLYKGSSTPTTPTTPTQPGLQNDGTTSANDWEVLRLTNQHRMSIGLAPLSTYTALQKVGNQRAYELYDYYDHTRPDGSVCWTAYRDYGITYYTGAAENIAMGYTSPADVVTGWLNSSGHRKNIENSSLTHAGMGWYYRNAYNYWSQNFLADRCAFSGLALSKTQVKAAVGTDLDTLLASADIAVTATCSKHGTCKLPLIAGMCTGYNANATGTQQVTVSYGGNTAVLTITR